MQRKRPPRINGFAYVGLHAYFLTICAGGRHPAFADVNCAQRVCEQFLRTSADYGFAVIASCVMPDHLHALVEGVTVTCDFRKFSSMFKQRSAFEYRRAHNWRLWQEGCYEHTIRDDESQLGIATYIIQNPVRAGLCATVNDYPYIGSERYTIPQLCDAIQTPPRRTTRP